MIVTVSSTRGAPGVTSWALLLAAAWPAEYGVERVLLEADPAGGVLGARYGLGVDPGVATLVAALRRSPDGRDLAMAEIGRHVAPSVWIVPEPESAERAAAVWAPGTTAADVAAMAAHDVRLWIVDAGRLQRGSFAAPFADRSALTLVLCRAGQEDLIQVPARVAALQRASANVGVLVVGKPGYDRAELIDFFGTGLLWTVAESRDVTVIAGAVLHERRARRSWVWRSAIELAGDVAERVHDAAARSGDDIGEVAVGER